MRLLTLFLPTLALSTLFPASVSSIHPHALAHRRDHAQSPASSIIASRQYRVPRDLLDVCINVNANLLADASQLLGLSSLLGALNLGADIQLCLCLKDLDLYLNTNNQLSALIGLLGKNTVGVLITALINTSPDAKQCTFPQHAHHTCNTSDPCHYACDPPYVSEGNQCVCAPPNVSCNGVCGEFPHGCSSAVPRSMATKSKAITTFAQAQASCKSGESVCGIPGSENTLSFECVDVSSTKDSCGGCMAPHPFYEAEPVRFSSGRDCSIIPNSKSTACSSSRCLINTCSDGWVPSLQKDACVPGIVGSKMRRVRKRSEVSSNEDVDLQITAVAKDVIALNLHGPYTVLTSILTSYSTDDLAHLDSIYSLVDGVNAATSSLLTSTSVPAVIAYANTLLDTSKLLQATVADCSHVNNLDIQTFAGDVDHIISAVNDLLALCHEHPNSNLTLRQSVEARGSSPISSLGSSLAPSSSSSSGSSTQPIIAGLTGLLSGLGIEGIDGNSGAVVDGLVGDDTANTVNNILGGLGIGPANYKRQAIPPITALVNATLSGDSALLNQLTIIVNLIINLTNSAPVASTGSPSTTTSSPGSSIDSTGSISSLSHCQIDPLIFTSLYKYSIDLIESPDLDSLCRNTGILYGTACSLRDLFEACPYVDALWLGDIEADLLLVLEEILYLGNYCIANIGAGSNGNGGNGSSGHSSVVLTTLTTATLASTSTSSIVGTTASASTRVVATSTISYIPSVTSTAILSSISNPTPTIPTHSTAATATDIPIVVSADDALSDLGEGGTKAVVTVDGLLGNDADQSVDQLLDGLGIGPHNVRRRNGRRQIVANVNATVDLGGLGGVIDGLVNLVLGLTNVGSVLPPVPGLLPSSSPPALTTTTPAAANPAVPAVPVPVPALPVPLPPLSSIPLLPLTDPVSSLVDQSLVTNVVTAVLSLLSLQSPSYAQLLHALDSLVAASSSSASAISGCSCVKELEGYDDVYRYLVDITQAAEALETLCKGRANGATGSGSSSNGAALSSVGASHLPAPTGSQPSASTSTPSTSPSVNEPLVLGLTKLLKGLGLNIPVKVVIDGLLSNSLDHTVNGILDGLGIGPNGARRRSQQDW